MQPVYIRVPTLLGYATDQRQSVKTQYKSYLFLRRPKVVLSVDPKSKKLNSNRPQTTYSRPYSRPKTYCEDLEVEHQMKGRPIKCNTD